LRGATFVTILSGEEVDMLTLALVAAGVVLAMKLGRKRHLRLHC
jgi:hypothetical protein